MSRSVPAKLYPSAGPVGSIYVTDDRKVYCRTYRGVRLLDPIIGPCLANYQAKLIDRDVLNHRMIRWSVGLGSLLGAGATGLIAWLM